VLLLLLAAAWEINGRHLDNQLLVPTFSGTVVALWDGIVSRALPARMRPPLATCRNNGPSPILALSGQMGRCAPVAGAAGDRCLAGARDVGLKNSTC
jgi:hypothetical protein